MRWPVALEEPVFRPPSEADSLILQLTVGCSWNRCTYCAMYRGKHFRVRPVEEVLAEVSALAPRLAGVRRVFLGDGDALAAPLGDLERALAGIRALLPDVTRVGLYADSRSILSAGSGSLARLRGLGLGIVYFGPESGDPETLRAVRKGATVERQLEACRVVRSAGLKLSVMVLLGLAGVAGSERHARATGRFLEAAAPTYAAALTVTPIPGTELHADVAAGRMALPDAFGTLQELAWMLEEMTGYRGQLHANHASSYLPLRLRLPADRERALALLRAVVARRDAAVLTPEWARGL